uniref:G_PROTEIN_RECEP_F1_2 domain-containing protein n=1 Tax=Parastrongyloides trichosuri TaxID=131310 RepID=A0A0N4ZI36_PARTI
MEMTNVFYFWINESTEEMIYDYVIFYEGLIGFIVNVITFLFIHFKPPKRVDPIKKILKWSRLLDAFVSLVGGPILQIRMLFPIQAAACNGLCHHLGGQTLCNIFVILLIISIFYIMTYVGSSYLLMYNVFVRKKGLYFLTKKEKLLFIVYIGILPVVTIGFTYDFPLNDKDVGKVYPDVSLF